MDFALLPLKKANFRLYVWFIIWTVSKAMVSAIDLFTQTARAATEISVGGIRRSKLILSLQVLAQK